ncbi:MFS transporter [Vibrio tapetis]|uniref:Permease n=1 Tax=Vibrio tapetis subsp. tapetis TaxID=1671868 RepID=A0A2N8ZL16_9VIBR|nr:MFS transporter [Vibrio tapetis]SON52577.1 Permease [Vibrio tapetis subsp. tapetis]
MSVIKNKRFHLIAISLVSALMGIGQNGLLISLPFLVEHSAFSLPTWSIFIAIGSVLFLPSAPLWGRYSDKHGPKKVIIQALIGMAVSFSLLCWFAITSKNGEASYFLCFIGLIVARIIYGCTVSGMVPASQHWAILLCGDKARIQAITSISIGLSAGRLVGPIISLLALKISPFAPLIIMILLPCIALATTLLLPAPNKNGAPQDQTLPTPWLPQRTLAPFLMSGLLLCAAIALLQYSFSPLILAVTSWSTGQLSNGIGLLLTISAACTFITQALVIKKKKLTPFVMYRFGGIFLVVGFALFLLPSIWGFGIAMAVTSVGAALLVPAYTSSATEKHNDAPATVAGYISMSHTIGYGLASLLAFTSTLSPLYPIYLCIAFSVLILATGYLSENTETTKTSGLP